MRLGSRAKLTIGIGVLAATEFVVLGLRDLSKPARPVPSEAERAQTRPAAAQALLAAATRAIRTGETITADMVRGTALDPTRFPMAAAPVEAIGKVATRDIAAGSLITRTALDREAKLAIRVPLGMRAIAIDTTAEIAVAGLLRPGDRVDVQVVYPGADAISGARGIGRSQAQTLLQMVQVLAVGDTVVGTQPAAGSIGNGAEDDGSPSRSSAPAPAVARTVTLALFPEQVSALSLAKSTGALYLSLRNPQDDVQPQVAQAVSNGPLPERAPVPSLIAAPAVIPQPARLAPAPARSRPQAPPHAIDLVVGDSHQVIYSGSDAR